MVKSSPALVTLVVLGLSACASQVVPAPAKPAASPGAAASASASASAASSALAPPAQAFAAEAPRVSFSDPDRRKKLAAAFDGIDAMGERERERQELPGFALGVIIDGELAHARGFGFADVDRKTTPDETTVFRIGSIGKSFTSLALLSLRDEGALRLDDPLSRWVPEAAGLVYPTHDQPPLTLFQLVTHTAGLPSNGAFELGDDSSEATVLKSLAGFALESTPGTTIHYSNVGFVLAGLAVAHAAHAPLREVVQKRIFTPLGMTSSAWDRAGVPEAKIATGYDRSGDGKLVVPPQWKVGATAGAGGIYSSVRDMARYVALQLSAYPSRNGADDGPIRRSTLREAHATGVHVALKVGLAPAPAKGEPLVKAEAESYAFGWSSAETCDFGHRVGHSGGMPGFSAQVSFLPDHGVGVVVLVNSSSGNPGGIAERVLDLLRKSGGLGKRVVALPEAFNAAMKKLLAVYNGWSDEGYAAMLSVGRPKIAEEREELEGYKALHGACSSFAPIELVSPSEGRFKVTCERGLFELKVNISPADGGIQGFVGITPEAPIPADRRKVLDRVIGLIGRWDAGAYPALLAHSGRTLDETAALFARLHADQDTCALASATQEGFDVLYTVTCARGPSLVLDLRTDAKNAGSVTRFDFRPGGQGTCPSR